MTRLWLNMQQFVQKSSSGSGITYNLKNITGLFIAFIRNYKYASIKHISALFLAFNKTIPEMKLYISKILLHNYNFLDFLDKLWIKFDTYKLTAVSALLLTFTMGIGDNWRTWVDNLIAKGFFYSRIIFC